MRQYNGQPPEGQQIQQVVEPGSLDKLNAACTLSVRGKKTDDRYIADVLVYECLALLVNDNKERAEGLEHRNTNVLGLGYRLASDIKKP